MGRHLYKGGYFGEDDGTSDFGHLNKMREHGLKRMLQNSYCCRHIGVTCMQRSFPRQRLSHLAKTIIGFGAAARPNGSKSRDPGWEGSSSARIGPSEKPGTGDRKVGKGRRRRREEQRGEDSIYGR
jgi:hypothetical protein